MVDNGSKDHAHQLGPEQSHLANEQTNHKFNQIQIIGIISTGAKSWTYKWFPA